jgi:hypothetical protein
MVHVKGLNDTAIVDILLNSDSEEDFSSDNNNELSKSGTEYESQRVSDIEDKLPMHSVDETAAQKN